MHNHDMAGQMTEHSAEQSKQAYIEMMGDALGSQYAELVQDIAHLHQTWFEYVELFGRKKSRVDLLNDTAPHFFRMVQDRLWETVMLQIARLTDPSHSMNNKNKANLSLQNLPSLISDAKLSSEIQKLCKAATDGVGFARDWRNRHIAHRDLKLAIDENAEPLPAVQMQQVNDALASFEAILNTTLLHFEDSEIGFKHMISPHTGAEHLIYLLNDALTAQRERQARIAAGDFSRDDFKARDL
jgi:hypothetical protein